MTTPQYELRYLPVESLIPSPDNPNEMDDETLDRLVEEIAEHGVIQTLAVVPLEDVEVPIYRIVGGQHRWMAAQLAGLLEVPCLILEGEDWQDPDLQLMTLMRLNAIHGEINPEKFEPVYDRVVERYGEDAAARVMGFMDQKAWESLVKQTKKALKEAFPKDMHKEIDARAKKAKTSEDLAKIADELLQKHGETLPQSYMVFTHASQQHIYVVMERRLKRVMEKLAAYSAKTGLDLGEAMAPALEGLWKTLQATKTVEPDED